MNRNASVGRNLFWVAMLTLSVEFAGCVSSPEKSGGDLSGTSGCGKTVGIFLGHWNDYYERGLSFLACERWSEAEQDLRVAISKRSHESRAAHTDSAYLDSVIPYFPHRELGVLLYQKGEYEAALQELEFSLTQESTDRAKRYLDKARKKLIDRDYLDRIPPLLSVTVRVVSDTGQGQTVSVHGVARDDTYISQVLVNGEPIRGLELSDRSVSFTKQLWQSSAEAPIRIEAIDLAGRSSHWSSLGVRSRHPDHRQHPDHQEDVLDSEPVDWIGNSAVARLDFMKKQ